MKRLNSASKKGNIVLQGLLFIIVLFALGITGFFAHMLLTQVNASVQGSSQVTAEAKLSLANNQSQSSSLIDGIFVSVFVLMWFAVLIATYQLKTAPVFFALFIIMFAIVMFVGLTLANAADDIANNSFVSTYALQMQKTVFIFQHFNYVLVFVLATMAITLWGKNLFDKTPF